MYIIPTHVCSSFINVYWIWTHAFEKFMRRIDWVVKPFLLWWSMISDNVWQKEVFLCKKKAGTCTTQSISYPTAFFFCVVLWCTRSYPFFFVLQTDCYISEQCMYIIYIHNMCFQVASFRMHSNLREKGKN